MIPPKRIDQLVARWFSESPKLIYAFFLVDNEFYAHYIRDIQGNPYCLIYIRAELVPPRVLKRIRALPLYRV